MCHFTRVVWITWVPQCRHRMLCVPLYKGCLDHLGPAVSASYAMAVTLQGLFGSLGSRSVGIVCYGCHFTRVVWITWVPQCRHRMLWLSLYKGCLDHLGPAVSASYAMAVTLQGLFGSLRSSSAGFVCYVCHFMKW